MTEPDDDGAGAVFSRKPAKTAKKARRWKEDEDQLLRVAVKLHGEKDWKLIASEVCSRNHVQCLQRWKKVRWRWPAVP